MQPNIHWSELPKEPSVPSGTENFFESYGEQPGRSKWWLKPTALVRFFKKFQDRCLIENLLSIGVSGVFCTTKPSVLRKLLAATQAHCWAALAILGGSTCSQLAKNWDQVDLKSIDCGEAQLNL